MISRDEFVLAPAEQRTMEVTVSDETRYVGAIAAFRDIRNAQWRVLVPASRKGLTVAVERARIMLIRRRKLVEPPRTPVINFSRRLGSVNVSA